jgi:adenylate kinase family enzyme
MSSDLERIVVVGTSCSGKTTYARRLAEILGHPYIELDSLHWLPDWVERPGEEFRDLVARAVSSDRWVIDGNYGTVRKLIWPRATCIVWLNYGFLTVLGRALRRTLRRSITGETLYSGNKESLRRSFLQRDSILLWVITTFRRRRKSYAELRAANVFNHLRWVEFRKPQEAQQFLRHGHTLPSR